MCLSFYFISKFPFLRKSFFIFFYLKNSFCLCYLYNYFIFVSKISIVRSIVSLCIQIFILETRWSNSLSTSSSVCAIVAFPHTTTASGKVSSLIEYFIEWRFFSVYFEFFGVSFYLHILYFVWRSLSVLLSLLICYLYFLMFLSLFLFLSLCSSIFLLQLFNVPRD